VALRIRGGACGAGLDRWPQPAALTKVRDESENGMAVVAAIKTGEQLRVGAVHDEAVAQKRLPGLHIVLIQGDG
jgi:hypothetical protein